MQYKTHEFKHVPAMKQGLDQGLLLSHSNSSCGVEEG